MIEERMRIPPELLKACVFVCRPNEVMATGFIVSVPGLDGPTDDYLVTAKHSLLDGSQVLIRFNTTDETSEFCKPSCSWQTHPTDETCDAAVTPITLPANADLVRVKRSTFLNPGESINPEENCLGTRDDFDRMKSPIQVGDEVAIPCLLSYAEGEERIQPVLRSGIIARLTDERFKHSGQWIQAWIVENISIAGVSGAPVFVRAPGRSVPDSVIGGVSYWAYFFGMMRGHWIGYASIEGQPDKREFTNIGLTVVTPAYKIAEIIDHLRSVD